MIFNVTYRSRQELAQMLLFLLENAPTKADPFFHHEVEEASVNPKAEKDYTSEIVRLLDTGFYADLLQRALHTPVSEDEPEHRSYRRIVISRLVLFILEHKLESKLLMEQESEDSRQRALTKATLYDRKQGDPE